MDYLKVKSKSSTLYNLTRLENLSSKIIETFTFCILFILTSVNSDLKKSNLCYYKLAIAKK